MPLPSHEPRGALDLSAQARGRQFIPAGVPKDWVPITDAQEHLLRRAEGAGLLPVPSVLPLRDPEVDAFHVNHQAYASTAASFVVRIVAAFRGDGALDATAERLRMVEHLVSTPRLYDAVCAAFDLAGIPAARALFIDSYDAAHFPAKEPE